MLLEICVSLVFVGVICDNSKLYIRPFSFCLVLNTVEKMHRWELRMNFYTVVLNTKLSETAKQQGIPPYSSDILGAQGGGRLLYYDANSANTPYRAGITQASEGVAITVGDWSNFITSLAIPKGGTTLYLYSRSNGIVTDWKAIN